MVADLDFPQVPLLRTTHIFIIEKLNLTSFFIHNSHPPHISDEPDVALNNIMSKGPNF